MPAVGDDLWAAFDPPSKVRQELGGGESVTGAGVAGQDRFGRLIDGYVGPPVSEVIGMVGALVVGFDPDEGPLFVDLDAICNDTLRAPIEYLGSFSEDQQPSADGVDVDPFGSGNAA